MPPRIIYDNLVLIPGAVIVPSSEETAFPRSALLRPLVSDILRFKRGWTVRLGENDALKFNRTGDLTATIAAGYYSLPADYAAAVVAALEAADPTPAWACSRDPGTNKFTISSDLAFVLKFGDAVAASVHLDLGFASVNTGSATSHTADNAAHQGRHSVNLDLLSARSFAVGIVRGHNVSAGGSVRLDGKASPLVGAGLDAAAADFSQALDGSDPRIAYFASQSKRYLRLVVTDVQNSAGYNELGVWCPGPYLDLYGFAPEVTDDRRQLSTISYALAGAHYQARRPRRKVWELRARNITAAKKTELDAFDDVMRAGGAYFFSFDTADPLDTRYVFSEDGVSFESQETDPVTWEVKLRLLEALG